jgi:predicted permease
MSHELRHAFRMLVKRPGLSLLAIVTLGLGIGATTSMFTVVHGVLLRPLPYPDAGRILQLFETADGGLTTLSPPNFLDWKTQARSFAAMAAYRPASVTLSGAGDAERVPAAFVEPELFGVLGVAAAIGRALETPDARPGTAATVVLGHGLWMRRFGGDPAVLGRTLTLDRVPRQVAGVMPPGFTFPDGVELWLPLTLTAGDLAPAQRGAHYLRGVGRLRPGVDAAAARDELNAIQKRIAAQHVSVAGYGAWAVPLLEATVSSVRRPLLMLFGAVGCVLLIGCANVATLLLAGATARRGEVAVRCALGAARWRIARQMLVESLALALGGGALGVLVAAWGVRALGALLPQSLPRTAGIGVDPMVLLFALAVSMLTGIIFGAAPAVHAAASTHLAPLLQDARRDALAGGRGRRAREAVVATEVALAVVLLVGAGLAVHSFARLTAIDPGFDASRSMALSLTLPDRDDPAAAARFFREYVEALAAHPEISSVGGVSLPPLSGSGFSGTFSILDGRRTEPLAMAVRAATPGYFETLRIPVSRGRGFTPQDTENAERVAVLGAEAARRFWPAEDPIGRRIRIHVGVGLPETERRIVGIAGDVRTGSLGAAPGPLVYVPHAQYPTRGMTVFARAPRGPEVAAAILREALRRADPHLAPTRMRSGDALVSSAAAQPRFQARLLGLFAAIALTLAAIGLYGVTAFAVAQRRAELGLRMALGADPPALVRLVIRQSARPVGAGLATGLLGAALVTRLFSTLFSSVRLLDPLTYTAVPVLLLMVVGLASYLPARRAARLDPLAALRE